ncbi:hypothetical protein ACSRA4_21845, partial [Salmonella enterica]|uniref:hypothetical protein n=1 Tax=Salmonella enterica TaxID=28901 RepID=UPI003EDC0735
TSLRGDCPKGERSESIPPHRHIRYKINQLQCNISFFLHKEARINGLFLHLNATLFRYFSRLNFLKSPAGNFAVQHK